MLHYFQEAALGAPLRIEARLLEHDAKRARLWLEMRSPTDGPVIAASEQLYLSVDQSAGARASPWRAETLAALEAMAEAQAGSPMPPLAGRGISLRRV
jgi:acyl-CoA thioester hydrolase